MSLREEDKSFRFEAKSLSLQSNEFQSFFVVTLALISEIKGQLTGEISIELLIRCSFETGVMTSSAQRGILNSKT